MKKLDLHGNWKSISTAVLLALGGLGAGAASNAHSASAHTISPKDNTMRMTKARRNKRTKLMSVNKANKMKRAKTNKVRKVVRNHTKSAPIRKMQVRRTSKKIFGLKKQTRKPKAKVAVKRTKKVQKVQKRTTKPATASVNSNSNNQNNQNNNNDNTNTNNVSNQLNKITTTVNRQTKPKARRMREHKNNSRNKKARSNYVGLNVKITSKSARNKIKRFFDASFGQTKVAKILASKLGDPYQWGGNGPHRFDCSGLMKFVMKHGAHINIPRTAQAQYQDGKKINNWKSLKGGDLLFFGASRKAISHVGMYIGHGNMMDAQNSGVILESPKNSWWHLVGSARVKGFNYPKISHQVKSGITNAMGQADGPHFDNNSNDANL